MIRPVILSGGAGTRLWPLSTTTLPKQFATLLPGGSLFARTVNRLNTLEGVVAPFFVTGSAHAGLAAETAADVGVTADLTIIEPEGRNTAPAALAAALCASPEEILVILPSDHLIADVNAFVAVVATAARQAEDGSIVTFGVTPTRVETGYGYIRMGDPVGRGFAVERFKEKPGHDEAARLLSDGSYLWNSGMFVVAAATLVEEASHHCPEILVGVKRSLRPVESGKVVLGDEFGDVQSISFDHAIMEKTRRAVVMPIDVGWDDVGSFEVLWEVSEKDDLGNLTSGATVLRDVSNSYVRATSRTVAVAGMSDVVVIETPEAVLVVPRDRAQAVHDLAIEADFGSS